MEVTTKAPYGSIRNKSFEAANNHDIQFGHRAIQNPTEEEEVVIRVGDNQRIGAM